MWMIALFFHTLLSMPLATITLVNQETSSTNPLLGRSPQLLTSSEDTMPIFTTVTTVNTPPLTDVGWKTLAISLEVGEQASIISSVSAEASLRSHYAMYESVYAWYHRDSTLVSEASYHALLASKESVAAARASARIQQSFLLQDLNEEDQNSASLLSDTLAMAISLAAAVSCLTLALLL